MKMTITGGAGFIGSNLCDYFVTEGMEVTCLDNLSTGFKHNIEHLLGRDNFRFVEGDIRDLDTCREVVAGSDVVLHEAALGSVPRSINDPINTNANPNPSSSRTSRQFALSLMALPIGGH